MSKIEFKEFVKKNPNLIKVVESNQTSWQKLYELYDLYGSDEIVKKYLKENKVNNINTPIGSNFKELVNLIKGVDLDTVQKGLNNLDKAIDAFKGILPDKTIRNNLYEPRPSYKYFED